MNRPRRRSARSFRRPPTPAIDSIGSIVACRGEARAATHRETSTEQSEYFTADGAARTHHNTAHRSAPSSKRERYRLDIIALAKFQLFHRRDGIIIVVTSLRKSRRVPRDSSATARRRGLLKHWTCQTTVSIVGLFLSIALLRFLSV